MAMHFPGVALVTGAGSGIGQQTALLIAKQGCSKISIADINDEGIAKTQKEIHALGTGCDVLPIHLDVQSQESVNSMIERTVKKFGRIDYACNAAGICIPGTSDTASAAEFDMQFQVNARGVWICQQAEINQMIKQTPLRSDDSKFESRGAIVNVASMAGLIGLPNLVGYGASKHAVIGLTKSDGMRYGANLIRINAVCPGAIQTPMLGSFASDGVEQVRQTLALKREGLPEEVAECLVWLMSHRASYVTAASFSIHGGMIS